MGRRKCCVVGCRSSALRVEDRGVTFHKFPLNNKTRNEWITECHMPENFNITKSSFVCSRHFTKTDFQAYKGVKYLLKNGVVPSIFQWSTLDAAKLKTISKVNDTTTASTSGVKRSASAEEGGSLAEPQKKMSRKTSDSAILVHASPEKSPKKQFNESFKKSSSEGINFAPGTKLEAQDFNEIWHLAKIIEVDNDEREVLIHFEKKGDEKTPGIFNEWIPMDSSRLRPQSYTNNLNNKTVVSKVLLQKTNSPIGNGFAVGQKGLARWNDSRRFPGTIQKVLDNDMYEFMFDDGFVKLLKGCHITKVKKSGRKKVLPTVAVAKELKKCDVNNVEVVEEETILTLTKQLPEIPKDGAWCCHWLNDTPLGENSTIDGYNTVAVNDWRLPVGFVKHLYNRSITTNVLKKWEIIFVTPNGQKLRNKQEVKQYLDNNKEKYDIDIFDFGIHKRRAKELGFCNYTQDFKQKPLNISRDISSPIMQKNIKQELSPMIKTDESLIEHSQQLEEGYVFVGSLKVQIIDNLFRCPQEGCFKNFRKENHLQIHIKHYHKEMAKLLGVCPKMSDLAYIRTMGHNIDDSLAKNHFPNSQFFEKAHQLDLQSRVHRKSLTSPNSNMKIENLENNKLKEEIVSPDIPINDKIADTDNVKIKVEQSDDDSKKKLFMPEETSNSKSTLEKVVLKIEQTNNHISDGEFDNKDLSEPAIKLSDDTKQHMLLTSTPCNKTYFDDDSIDADVLPKVNSVNKIKFKQRNIMKKRKLNIKRLGRPPLNRSKIITEDASDSIKNDLNNSFICNEETRDSFIQYSDRIKKSTNEQFNENTNSLTTTTTTIERSLSPKYINEGGEIIKIVRMRQEEIINCLCGYTEEDGLMIQCELCLCWQHGACNGIEKECQVPEKYVCYICRNPQRGRLSMKYIHDQDWLYEGKLPVANYHVINPYLNERFDLLKQSHILTGNLLELKKFLYSLKVKKNICENKDHPKMYLWSKKWELSPHRNDIHNKIKNEDEIASSKDVATVANDLDIKNNIIIDDVIKNNDELVQILEGNDKNINDSFNDDDIATTTIITTENKEDSTMLNKNDVIDTNDKTISETKGININDGINSFVKNELTDNDNNNIMNPILNDSLSEEKIVINEIIPHIPQPEAPIDSLECQSRLLEHIQKQQTMAMSRLQTIESQISALESMDNITSGYVYETTETLNIKLKSTIKMLIKDLLTIKKLSYINNNMTIINDTAKTVVSPSSTPPVASATTYNNQYTDFINNSSTTILGL